MPACLGFGLFVLAMFILSRPTFQHDNIESNYENSITNYLKMPPQRAQVPRNIWALWDQGVENAPLMEKTCLWSHKAANPTFKTRVLDLQTAINLTDVFSVIKKNSWDNMTIQAKSDVIRVLLLHKYGGVWADATLCMVEGLEHWLHRDVDFTTFIRHDQKARESSIKPWMSSWFMVSRPNGVVISALREAVINYWDERADRGPGNYFWLHRLFSNLISTNNRTIMNAFDPRTAISADPFHCMGTDIPMLPTDLTMFKIKTCNEELRESVFQKINDVYGDAEETEEDVDALT